MPHAFTVNFLIYLFKVAKVYYTPSIKQVKKNEIKLRCRGEMRLLCWAVQGAWSLRTSLRPLDFIVIVYYIYKKLKKR